jgi:hypothetical protein
MRIRIEMKIKFNKELLLYLFPTEGKAKLIGEYDNINCKTKIKYTCSNCDTEEEKPFSRLYACGIFCRKCTYKRGSEAGIKTLQQKYGSHVKNAMDVPELVEKINNTIKKNYGEDIRTRLGRSLAESRKVQWEKQKTNWKGIEDKGIMKCRTCKVEKNLDCFQKGIRKYNTWNTQCYACKNIKRASNRQEWSKNAPIEEILEEYKQRTNITIKTNVLRVFNYLISLIGFYLVISSQVVKDNIPIVLLISEIWQWWASIIFAIILCIFV